MNKNRLITTGIVALALFFCFRELGTFPSAWLDDSLFMLVAQSVVRGEGYSLPIMWEQWNFPFVLAVGPTAILPSALSMYFFGESITIARIPAALYLLATIWAVFIFAKRRAGLANAQMAVLLLITLSAFINNGKPVLGEVPGIFFLMIGILLLNKMDTTKRAVVAGAILGVAVVTKLTLGIIFPALAIAVVISALQKEKATTYRLITASIVAIIIFLLWQCVETYSRPGGVQELLFYGFADGGSLLFQLFYKDPRQLLRFQFLYFDAIAILGFIGMYKTRHTLQNGTLPFVTALIILFCLYFLNGPGWYRHLITAHVLLIPFVPVGTWTLLGKRLGTLGLIVFITAQGWWQLTYQGSVRSSEAAEATIAVRALPDEKIVIEQPEVYFRLPDSDKYNFVSLEFFRDYLDFGLPLTQEEHCLPVVRKLSTSQMEEYGDRLSVLHKRFVLIQPEKGCSALID